MTFISQKAKAIKKLRLLIYNSPKNLTLIWVPGQSMITGKGKTDEQVYELRVPHGNSLVWNYMWVFLIGD